MIAKSEMILFFERAALAAPGSPLSELFQSAGAHLGARDRASLEQTITGMMVNPGFGFDEAVTPMPRAAFEILKGSFLKFGYLEPGFRLVADYLTLAQRGRRWFIEALVILLTAELNILVVFDLIAYDHPDEEFKGIARGAIQALSSGQALAPIFLRHESQLGSAFTKAWEKAEQQGDFVQVLRPLLI